MKITNKFGVPETLVALASREYYSKGKAEYSVTELMSPVRVRRLQERYKDDIERDVSEMLWSLMGSALHVVMERGQLDDHIQEERIFAQIDGITISGAIDVQQQTEGGVVIIDYKFTSAWSVMNDKSDWTTQLNIYKWLVETQKNQKVVGLKICALIRDFNRHDYREGYPQAPIVMVNIPMWSNSDAEIYIRQRIEAHEESKFAAALGQDINLCSDEERWASETTYAVRREGRKTAIRVFKSLDEAQELAEKEKGYVETRPGEPRRCVGNFCGVAKWCSQYIQETVE